MRYVLAIAALVISGVLLLLGIGQRTFLAGPAEISFPVETNSEAGYAFVDGAELGKVPGQANVVVKGGEAFVATGQTRDVEGWLEPYLHAELTVDKQGRRLLSALIAPAVVEAPEAGAEAETPAPADPRGSDLWLEERSIDDQGGDGADASTLRVPVSLGEDQSVLIASNGTDPVPSDVSLVWAQDRDTPWAGPLLVGGALFAVVGGILYLLAVDHNRRGLGPRRGRRGPLQGIRNAFRRRGGRAASGVTAGAGEDAGSASGPGAARMDTARRGRVRRAAAIPALGLAAVVGLTGCSPSYWPQFGPAPAEEDAGTPTPSSAAPVPVTDGQLSRIVQRISKTANEADDALSAEVLQTRFTGDALAQRTANYRIRAAMPDYSVVPPRLTDEELEYELVQSTESWPRTVFVTVASTRGADDPEDAVVEDADGGESPDEEPQADPPASPSLALVLTQETPQDNYHVSRLIALRGGISMPQAAPAEEGTALLANDIETLVLPPGEVGAQFAAVLQGGPDVPEAEAFDIADDTLLQSYGKALAEKAQAQSDEKGQTMVYSVTAHQGEEEPVALSTGVGGALVATTVIEEQVVDAAGGRYKPQAKDAVTALSGLEGEQERLVQEVAHQLLFYVPSKTDGSKIQLLGVTSELVGVRN